MLGFLLSFYSNTLLIKTIRLTRRPFQAQSIGWLLRNTFSRGQDKWTPVYRKSARPTESQRKQSGCRAPSSSMGDQDGRDGAAGFNFAAFCACLLQGGQVNDQPALEISHQHWSMPMANCMFSPPMQDQILAEQSSGLLHSLLHPHQSEFWLVH